MVFSTCSARPYHRPVGLYSVRSIALGGFGVRTAVIPTYHLGAGMFT